MAAAARREELLTDGAPGFVDERLGMVGFQGCQGVLEPAVSIVHRHLGALGVHACFAFHARYFSAARRTG